MTRRTFLNRLSVAVAAVFGTIAAVYAPSCLRALEPVVNPRWPVCWPGFFMTYGVVDGEPMLFFDGNPVVLTPREYSTLGLPVPHPTT
jgi:hypothetical protein